MGINILGQEIGPCWLTFDSLSLGKTIDSIKVSYAANEKEMMAAQNGTKPEDYVDTGIQWVVEAKIKTPTIAMLNKLMPGLNLSGGATAWKHTHQSLFQSHRDNYAKELVVTLHDSATNLPSTDPNFSFTIPLASPRVTDFKEMGPDTETSLAVSFRSLYDDATGCHIYSGAAASLNIT